MVLPAGDDPHASARELEPVGSVAPGHSRRRSFHGSPMMKYQFVTLIATILLVGATVIGVNLTIVDGRFAQVDSRFAQVDARFEQVDARFEQVDARFERVEGRLDRLEARVERMDRRIDEGFREMAAAIGRLEGLIQGFHGTARTSGEEARAT
ncbi:MAG: hypothetical protein F4X99_05910 [Gammaproteobacteria bacterium]|nr:hypothetical protein [Gammaproteobacteria bacterium]